MAISIQSNPQEKQLVFGESHVRKRKEKKEEEEEEEAENSAAVQGGENRKDNGLMIVYFITFK